MRSLLSLLLFIATNAVASDIYGYYSNVESQFGEPSGYEVLIMDNGQVGNSHISVLFQHFEGSPNQPELLDCLNCSPSTIVFKSQVMGTFIGKVANGKLTGEFKDLKLPLTLHKSNSFWQKH